jgi:hypothetical protein
VRECRRAGAVSVTPLALHLRPGVREHYLSWLATARPDLLDLYERRFRGRSYQPRAEQDRLSDLVAKATGVTHEMKPSAHGYRSEHTSSGDEKLRHGQLTAVALGDRFVYQRPACPTTGPAQLELFTTR